MAYEHNGLAAALELVDRLHYGRLVEGVECAGGLVEQDERRVVEEDARKADALALAARERVAQLGNGRVETLRQAVDEGGKRSGAASVEQLGGYVCADAPEGGLQGGHVYLDIVSVGATMNIMLAAVLCSGMTIIENCAKEPHIVDLANFLNAMGAKVSGAGTDVIKVRGVAKLAGGSYTIIPDQIEAGTYMAAAAAVGGDVTVDNVIPKHLDCITAKLREMGARVTEFDDSIRVEADRRLRRSNVKTMPYPGFPTDMQPQIAVCMALAEGTSLVTEGIYDNRFRYTAELNRMGASIQVESKTAVIDGVTQLHGCEVRACDLRAGAAMVIAALCAEGTTTIEDAHYIERGYEDIIGKFAAIGGKIRRIETFEGSSQDAAG